MRVDGYSVETSAASREQAARSSGGRTAGGVGHAGSARRPRAGGGRETAAVSSRDVLEPVARRMRALGHPLRLELVQVLADGPRSVTDLARIVGEEHHLVSKHLSELLRHGLVARQREGTFAVYSLPDAVTLRAIGMVTRSVVDHRARLAQLAVNARAGGDAGSAG